MPLFDDLVAGSRRPQLPRKVVVNDLVTLIRGMTLEKEDCEALYEAIRGRLKSKSCRRCDKLKVEGFEGSVVEWRGFGKTFLCVSCQEVLSEKGQLDK